MTGDQGDKTVVNKRIKKHTVATADRLPAGLRAACCALLLVAVATQVGCEKKRTRADFMMSLSEIEREASDFVELSPSETARFLHAEMLFACTTIKEKELWSLGAGYVVFLRDDLVLVRGHWIAVDPDGNSVVVTVEGERVGSFDLFEFDVLDNVESTETKMNGAYGARFQFAAELQYGSDLTNRIIEASRSPDTSLEFSIQYEQQEVAVVKRGMLYDSRK